MCIKNWLRKITRLFSFRRKTAREREKEQQMREGYKVFRDEIRAITKASVSLQKKVIPDY